MMSDETSVSMKSNSTAQVYSIVWKLRKLVNLLRKMSKMWVCQHMHLNTCAYLQHGPTNETLATASQKRCHINNLARNFAKCWPFSKLFHRYNQH